mmetsp:Transcript_8629/g.12903  ORF Transcript_8629/g.12903 Transcript_8629/m.12903 type:complete len:317 (+) Transcript_8629:392-1342(+)
MYVFMEKLTTLCIPTKSCDSLRFFSSSTKGHIRLASVYIALGHSNDACQALQSAIGIEPSNSLARALLTNELRRDNRPNDEPHSNDYIGTEYVELDAIDGEFLVNRTINHSIADEHNGRGISLMESMNRRLLLLRSWYRTSGENTKTCVQISCCILILYVAFGGRFGLDTLTAGGGYSHRQADYSSKNAYERFRSINSAYGSRNSNSWHGRRTTGHQRSYTYRYSGSRQHATTSNSSYSRNLPFVLVIILVFILHCLGVPIGTVAPILFGLRRRRFGFGVGNMRFGGGGFDFGNGGLFGARGMRVPMNYGMYRQHR